MKIAQETPQLKSEAFVSLVAEMKDRLVQAAQDGEPLHQVEQALWQQLLRLGREALGQFLALVGTGDQGETVTLPEGQVCQRLEQVHERRYVSIFGEFVLRRTVYGSREGQKIAFVPLDNRLQVPESVFSYVLQDWDQSFCAEQAFGPSAAVIQRILGLRQSVDSLETMNLAMAPAVAAYREERPVPPASAEGELLVTSSDGKGIVMRRPEGEAAPSGHRRKGDKASQKRMATVGAVYTVDRYVRTPDEVVAALFRDGPRPAERRPQPQHKHVWASLPMTDEEVTISGLDFVYTWLHDEVERRNPDRGKEQVHLSDGQECLWTARQEYLAQGKWVEILDLLHVSSRVWQAAHVFHREGSAEAEQFVREQLLRILQGQAASVVRGLRGMARQRGLVGAKKKAVQKVCAYVQANRERMRYDHYLAQGYPIASGVIEGACRHLVKDRMERAGMHWTPAGAQAMLDVRSVAVNGEWAAYQAYRIQQEAQRLYPFRKVVEGHNYRLAG